MMTTPMSNDLRREWAEIAITAGQSLNKDIPDYIYEAAGQPIPEKKPKRKLWNRLKSAIV